MIIDTTIASQGRGYVDLAFQWEREQQTQHRLPARLVTAEPPPWRTSFRTNADFTANVWQDSQGRTIPYPDDGRSRQHGNVRPTPAPRAVTPPWRTSSSSTDHHTSTFMIETTEEPRDYSAPIQCEHCQRMFYGPRRWYGWFDQKYVVHRPRLQTTTEVLRPRVESTALFRHYRQFPDIIDLNSTTRPVRPIEEVTVLMTEVTQEELAEEEVRRLFDVYTCCVCRHEYSVEADYFRCDICNGETCMSCAVLATGRSNAVRICINCDERDETSLHPSMPTGVDSSSRSSSPPRFRPGKGDGKGQPDEQSSVRPEDVPVEPQGITGDEVAARLRRIADAQPGSSAAAWIHRQEQIDALSNVTPPIGLTPTTEWTPPFTYQPTQANHIPAIFSNPLYTSTHIQFPRHTMDPPLVQEVIAQQTGIPLDQPFICTNRFVREMTDAVHHTMPFRTGGDMPYTAYGAEPPPGYVRLNPVPDSLHLPLLGNSPQSSHFLAEISNIHHSQQRNILAAEERRKGKGKGKRKGPPPTFPDTARYETPAVAVHRFDGTDTTCSICIENFIRGQMTYRLVCNHLFHEECWNSFIERADDIECPNCRGPPNVKALFCHLGSDDPQTERRAAAKASAQSAADRLRQESATQTAAPSNNHLVQSSSNGSFRSVYTAIYVTETEFAEWSRSYSPLSPDEYIAGQVAISEDDEETQEIHIKIVSKTKLPDGRLSLLVDLGSMINIIGANTEREFAERAARHSLSNQYIDRETRLKVTGVGAGSAHCDVETIAQIAVKFEDQPATRETFKANVAEGVGADLPAILGSISMQDRDSVLILRRGKEMIAFPGPGGYKIEWSPGTRLLPMTAAPSGHLVIPCDLFDDLPSKAAPEEKLSFWTDHSSQDQQPQGESVVV